MSFAFKNYARELKGKITPEIDLAVYESKHWVTLLVYLDENLV